MVCDDWIQQKNSKYITDPVVTLSRLFSSICRHVLPKNRHVLQKKCRVYVSSFLPGYHSRRAALAPRQVEDRIQKQMFGGNMLDVLVCVVESN